MADGIDLHDAVPTGNTYDKYASTNPVERRLMAGFFAALEASLPQHSPRRILEVGIGEGEIASLVKERFPRATIVGLDLPDRELAAQWAGRSFCGLFGDVTRLPFPDGTFDLVLAIEVLEHVDDPTVALQELRRVASADVVVSVPREPIWRAANMVRGKYLRDFGNTPGHVQHWSRRRFTELVGHHLDIVSVRSPLPWTMLQARVP